MRLPRYTQARTTACGVVEYRFNPPQKLVDAGVVTRRQFGSDLKQVRKLVREDNQKIDEWYDKNATGANLKSNSTLTCLINSYLESYDFQKLRDFSQKDYKYFLSVANKSLGQRRFMDISSKLAKKHYQLWLERGVSFANHVCTCVSRVYNHAIEQEQAYKNPFANIKRVAAQKRTAIWKRDEVKKFLDVAYADFSTRSIALIVQMAYEFCQRVGDMRVLEWDRFNKDMTVLYLQQSKRRAEVELPVNDILRQTLIDQRKDFGFQRYVAPNVNPTDGAYHPYGKMNLSQLGRRVIRRAKLSDDLRLLDLRRSGIMEMVDGGVPLPQIMSVSGHANPASVTPYMKNTLASATNALTTRKTWVSSAMKQQEGV